MLDPRPRAPGRAIVAAALALATASAADAVTLQARLVATLFSAAPGTGLNFGGLGAPILNERGEVAFSAGLGTPQQGLIAPNDSIWVWRDGTFQAVALPGQAAPGTGGETFEHTFGLPHLNDAGELAFSAKLASSAGVTTANDDTFYVGAPSSLALALRQGSVAVAGHPAVTTIPALVELGQDGQILTEVNLGSSPALLLGEVGALARVAGNVADFGLLGLGAGFYRDATTGGTNRFFHGSLAAPDLAFSESDPVGPDAPGAQIESFDGVVSAAGRGLFFSSLVQGTGGVTAANDAAVVAWDAAAGVFDVLLREGEELAGLPGWSLSTARQLTLGEDGHAAFVAVLRDALGSTRTGVMAGSLEEGFSLVVLEGGQAPGLASGATIRPFFAAGTPFSNFTSQGLVVFEANFDLPGGSAGSVLYALLPSGELRVVAQTGDLIAIEGGQLRPVLGFSLADQRVTIGPSTYSSQRVLREDGVLAVQIGYGSGTNAANFLLDVGYVPEPGTLLLLSTGLAGLGAARARRGR